MTDSLEDDFIRKYAGIQRKLFAFIIALEPNQADADEVLQETAAALWRKRQLYNESRDFLKWAMSFARIEVLRRRQQRQRSRLVFSNELTEKLALRVMQNSESYDDRAAALAECIRLLPAAKQQVLSMRYSKSASIEEISRSANKSTAAVYKLLSRTHDALMHCVRRKLALLND